MTYHVIIRAFVALVASTNNTLGAVIASSTMNCIRFRSLRSRLRGLWCLLVVCRMGLRSVRSDRRREKFVEMMIERMTILGVLLRNAGVAEIIIRAVRALLIMEKIKRVGRSEKSVHVVMI